MTEVMDFYWNFVQGVFVKDLSSYVVKNVPDMMDILNKGQNARAVRFDLFFLNNVFAGKSPK